MLIVTFVIWKLTKQFNVYRLKIHISMLVESVLGVSKENILFCIVRVQTVA